MDRRLGTKYERKQPEDWGPETERGKLFRKLYCDPDKKVLVAQIATALGLSKSGVWAVVHNQKLERAPQFQGKKRVYKSRSKKYGVRKPEIEAPLDPDVAKALKATNRAPLKGPTLPLLPSLMMETPLLNDVFHDRESRKHTGEDS